VIRSSKLLEEFEREFAATHLARLSYTDALGIFTALWRHARRLNPDFPARWEDDIEADVELARVLNGLGRHP
jgi:hypothetical protein